MGVTIIAGTDGWIIDAPAATAYAVLPVGVETISPSPWTDVINFPSKYRSMLERYGEGPLSITTSLSTNRFVNAFWLTVETSGNDWGLPKELFNLVVFIGGADAVDVVQPLLTPMTFSLRIIIHRSRLRRVSAAWPMLKKHTYGTT